MTAFTIRLIAVITMIVDHIGLFFFQNITILRLIGRISFLLFAWLIANGAYHTHNIHVYFKRLVLCALISQVPFILANRQLHPDAWFLNALFTLSIGLGAIMLVQKTSRAWLRVVITFGAVSLAQILPTDYGAFGVLIVASCYFFFNRPLLLLLSQIALYFGEFFFHQIVNHFVSIEVLGIFGVIFVLLYNGKPGPKTRYLVYIFYPLHYVIIYCLQLVL
ncbi:MAG: TraX family protein [Methylococcales bacterium]